MRATPFYMFTGQAEEAMRFYAEVLPGTRIVTLEHHAEGGQGGEPGKVRHGELELAGQRLRFFDSPPVHAFSFTPSISLFVECDDLAQFEQCCARLLEGGKALMPPDDYGFSRRFAWVQDRYGPSWQINLA